MAGQLAGADPKIKEIITSLDDDKIDMLAATSVLQQKATDIRNQRVNWQSYFQSQMISQEDYNFIVAFDVTDSQKKSALLKNDRHQAAQTLLNLLGHVSKDQTLQYILVLVDDMLQEDRSRVEIFHEYALKKKESVWGPFLNLLNRQDGFITNMTSRIIAKIACWSQTPMERSDLHFYLTWLKDQLKSQNNEYIQSVGRCMQMMLRIDEYRFAFVSVDGISTLLSVLAGRVNFQVQYQLIFCLWVLTFNPLLAEKMNKFNVIPILADILSDSVKEKVTRIILAVFRNLIEKPEDAQVAKEHCIAMVQSKVLKQLQILEQRKFDDEDITADVEFLSEKLQASVQDLSSFDEYATEVKSGRLEWSPVHKSKFWRENAQRLNEKNYELLRILIHLLETSKDPLVLSVASFDIGEYVRHYPRGKQNSLSIAMMKNLTQNIKSDRENPELRAIVITGDGPVFSAGHNLKELADNREKQEECFKLASELMLSIIDSPVPVIAKVDGVAAAAGCQLVAQCDIAVCSGKSTFSTPGANVGIFCSTPGIALARSVNKMAALYMLYTGLPIDGNQAMQMGLVTKVCPSDKLDQEVDIICNAIKLKSRDVIELGKRFYYKQIQCDVRTAYEMGGNVMVENLQMDDSKEGIRSFIEKRKPQWGTSKKYN